MIRLLVLMVLPWLSFKSVGVCLRGMLWLSLQTFIDNVSLINLSIPHFFVLDPQEDQCS